MQIAFAKASFIVAMATIFVAPSYAQLRGPTDVELRSAYCLRVYQSSVALVEGLLKGVDSPLPDTVKALQEERENLRRLQAYLVPKFQYVDAIGLQVAMSRADQDMAANSAAANACTPVCNPQGKTQLSNNEIDSMSACYQKCGRNAAADRLSACRPINWLPF